MLSWLHWGLKHRSSGLQSGILSTILQADITQHMTHAELKEFTIHHHGRFSETEFSESSVLSDICILHLCPDYKLAYSVLFQSCTILVPAGLTLKQHIFIILLGKATLSDCWWTDIHKDACDCFSIIPVVFIVFHTDYCRDATMFLTLLAFFTHNFMSLKSFAVNVWLCTYKCYLVMVMIWADVKLFTQVYVMRRGVSPPPSPPELNFGQFPGLKSAVIQACWEGG